MPPILASFSAKRITKQILVIGKLNGRKHIILRGFVCGMIRQLKGTACSKSVIETQE